MPDASPNPDDLHALRAMCVNCRLRELCLPVGLSDEDMRQLDQLVQKRRRVKAGQALCGIGDPFEAIYAIRSGFFKTTLLHENGHEQVTGFHMSGELLGLDGIGSGRHTCATVALEDAEVCVMPFGRFEELSRVVQSLQRHFHQVMGRELVREQQTMMLLGSMRADQRLAAFLLNLQQRYARLGYSPAEFNLRMTRQEIGSYLGLKIETVSRTFSRFHQEAWVDVQQKHIRIIDEPALRRLLSEDC